MQKDTCCWCIGMHDIRFDANFNTWYYLSVRPTLLAGFCYLHSIWIWPWIGYCEVLFQSSWPTNRLLCIVQLTYHDHACKLIYFVLSCDLKMSSYARYCRFMEAWFHQDYRYLCDPFNKNIWNPGPLFSFSAFNIYDLLTNIPVLGTITKKGTVYGIPN